MTTKYYLFNNKIYETSNLQELVHKLLQNEETKDKLYELICPYVSYEEDYEHYSYEKLVKEVNVFLYKPDTKYFKLNSANLQALDMASIEHTNKDIEYCYGEFCTETQITLDEYINKILLKSDIFSEKEIVKEPVKEIVKETAEESLFTKFKEFCFYFCFIVLSNTIKSYWGIVVFMIGTIMFIFNDYIKSIKNNNLYLRLFKIVFTIFSIYGVIILLLFSLCSIMLLLLIIFDYMYNDVCYEPVCPNNNFLRYY